MDVSKVSAAAEQGAVLELKDPAGDVALKEDGTPVTITLAGTESKKWRKARNAVGDKFLRASRPGGKATTMEEAVADQAFQLASVTLEWDGIGEFLYGHSVEMTLANAKSLYIAEEFVREQVDTFVGNRANFWKAA
jgi:hypothetical protein